MQEGLELFTRIFMKYDILEKAPIDIGIGKKLTATHAHMVAAIGKEYGKTVTALSDYFMITKGAVSQIVSKLDKAGYVAKTKKKGNDKEIILELTDKGWKVFDLHEKYTRAEMNELMQIRNKYSEAEHRLFLNMLNDVDIFFGAYIAKKKNR